MIFPNILAVNSKYGPMFQVRVPINDHETRHCWYQVKPLQPGQSVPDEIPIWDNPYQDEHGKLIVDNINAQDMMAWITQGPISDRTAERLGTSDKGVILFRSLLREQIERIARGQDPLGVVRDPANEPMIAIRREEHALRAIGINYDLMGTVEKFRDERSVPPLWTGRSSPLLAKALEAVPVSLRSEGIESLSSNTSDNENAPAIRAGAFSASTGRMNH